MRWSILAMLFIAYFLGRDTYRFERWENCNVVTGDVVEYYHYLPSFVIYGTQNAHEMRPHLPDYVAGRIWTLHHENGPFIKMTMGTAVCYSPFFLIAHWYASSSDDHKADGYSAPYAIALSLAGLFFGIFGLWMLRLVLKHFFNEIVTAVTLVLVTLATNLHHYTVWEPGMSHVFTFAWVATFLWLTIKWHKKPSRRNSILLGLVGGIILLIRPTNALIALVFVLWEVWNWEGFKQRLAVLWQQRVNLILISIAALLVFSIQMAYWKHSVDHWWHDSYPGEAFHFGKSHVMDGLFSFRKGWLLYTPIMLFALLGFLVKGKDKRINRGLGIFAVLYIFIAFSWWCWWYGGSYGARTMVDIYAVLALPLAAGVNWIAKSSKPVLKIGGITLVLIVGSITLWHNLHQQYQYRIQLLDYDGMTEESYRASFGKNFGQRGYGNLLLRPEYRFAGEGINEYVPLSAFIEDSRDQRDIESDGIRAVDHYVSDKYAHGGKYSYRIDSTNRISPTIEFLKSQKWKEGTRLRIKMSAWVLSESSYDDTKVYLAYDEITGDHEQPIYQIDLDWKTFKEREWQYLEVEHDVIVPTDPNPETTFRLFVKNQGNTPAWVDDLEIVFLYAEVE